MFVEQDVCYGICITVFVMYYVVQYMLLVRMYSLVINVIPMQSYVHILHNIHQYHHNKETRITYL